MSEGISWRLLDHTGDMAVLVRARTLRGLFDGAARALFGVILDLESVEERTEVVVRVEGAVDAEDLLVRFLSELLFLHDARGWLFHRVRIEELETNRVTCVALGEAYDPRRHRVARQVKAVTYHGLRLLEGEGGWSARVVLDL